MVIDSCLLKKYSAGENPMLLSGYQFVWGGIVMMVLDLVCAGIFVVNKKEK